MTQNNPLFPPRGALRAVVEYIHNQAPYPIPEVALAAGLGLFAGIAGRVYQTPDPMAGLNLYVMVVAATGKGKAVYEESNVEAAFPPSAPPEGYPGVGDAKIYRGTVDRLTSLIAIRFFSHPAK